MDVAILLGICSIYILMVMHITLLLMRIPKKPLSKRIVLYLSTLTAILIFIKVQDSRLWVSLLVFYVYIFLATFTTRLLMRIPKEARNKRIVLYLSILTAILIPIWDVPLIDWKFNQLCKTEAGVHVYEKVFLGPEYWKENGTLKFLPTRDLKKVFPGEFELAFERDFYSFSEISRERWQIKRKKDQKIIGEEVYIRRGRNWLVKWIRGPKDQKAVSKKAYFRRGSNWLINWMWGLEPEVVCPDPETYTRIVEAVFKQPPK